MLERFGTIIPPFWWTALLKALFITFWDDRRELVISGNRENLIDLQLALISSTNTPHLDLTPDLQQL